MQVFCISTTLSPSGSPAEQQPGTPGQEGQQVPELTPPQHDLLELLFMAQHWGKDHNRLCSP